MATNQPTGEEMEVEVEVPKPGPSVVQPAQPNETASSTPTASTGNATPSASKPKRRMVDADDNTIEIPSKKRGNVELDKEKRDQVLRFVLAAHIRITVMFYGSTDISIFDNLHISQQVSSIFCTVHSCLRQNSIHAGNLAKNMKDKMHSLHISEKETKSISHQEFEEEIKKLATSFGLVYERPNERDSNHWYGTISPIICFINLFKTRLNELRVGHGSFTSRKRDGETYHVSVAQYGFYPAHHVLLEGISLTPEKKSGMAQSLGPLTALISLAKADPDSKYSKRWKMAVQRNCSFLPEIESIISVVCMASAVRAARL